MGLGSGSRFRKIINRFITIIIVTITVVIIIVIITFIIVITITIVTAVTIVVAGVVIGEGVSGWLGVRIIGETGRVLFGESIVGISWNIRGMNPVIIKS